jgi:hypothetical protein
MIKLEAPWPAPSVVTVMPNPQLSDVETRDQTVNRHRSMSNVLYSYAKDGGTSKLTYTFSVSRMKSLEVQAFVETMIGQQIKMTNHKNEVWFVYIDNNPFEASQSRRAGGSPGNETDSISLSFVGVKQ